MLENLIMLKLFFYASDYSLEYSPEQSVSPFILLLLPENAFEKYD